MRCCSIHSLLVLVLALALPSLVHAVGAPVESPAYGETIDQALAEFDRKAFEESRALLGKAHAIYPNARTLRGLGMVEFELRNYGTSIQYLEQALVCKVKPLDGALRVATEQLLDRARDFVARVALKLEPGTASVRVDGMPVELGAGSSLILQVGQHVIEIEADKFTPETRRVSLRGGENQTLTIVLSPLLGSDSAGNVDGARPLRKNPWLWTAVGVSVVGFAVAAVFLLKPETKERMEPVTTANTPPGSTLQGLVTW